MDPRLWANSPPGPMIYDHPITVAYAYEGYTSKKVAEIHSKWGAVPGGYALLQQKQISYSSTGAITATILSTVTSPATYVMSESPTIAAKLGSLVADVSCYFTPTVAYAQGKKGGEKPVEPGPVAGFRFPVPGGGCGGPAAIFALNTATVAVESRMGVLALWELPLYIGAWTAWTHSLWDLLHCLDKLRRCSGPYCTGGGSTW